jgi:predicted nucleic acid-binding protein
VTLIIDAAPIVAAADPDEPRRAAVLEAMRAEPGALVIPAPVTAEIDYLFGRRFGRPARSAFLRDLVAGRFAVACLERDDYETISGLERRYADLELGLADCAVVTLAQRLQTDRILSFDERHFRTVTPLQGGAFQILPADD